MKLLSKSLSLLVFISLAGCSSHSIMRGSVAMKISEHEAHVCMNDDEVKIGDRVTAFTSICSGKGSGEVTKSCEKKEIGRGTVTAIVNSHYSVVKFDDGTKFAEGTFVEKKN